jgi:hypothetical protein
MSKEEEQPTARKDDSSKLRFDLIPPEALEGIADIFTYGSQKYNDRNWEKGLELMRLYAAVQRHLNEWHKGIDIDPESGKPHLAHAATGICMMITLTERNPKLDNRPKIGRPKGG